MPVLDASNVKRTSVVRRVWQQDAVRGNVIGVREANGFEGDVCVFQVAQHSPAALVEDPYGRFMTLLAGDLFIGTPGFRASTRWVVGEVPPEGLVPGELYWIIADCGIMGRLISDSPRRKEHLVEARYLGVVTDDDGRALNLAQFALPAEAGSSDRGAPVFLVLGTSSEVGKTTAAIAIIRTLRECGIATVTAAKMTGTSSFNEIARFRDFGATQVVDPVDFGLPSTYSQDTAQIGRWFDHTLGVLLSARTGGVVIECGGDIFGANVPVFLDRLKAKRANIKVILVAPDALAAEGAQRALRERGITLNLITGPCTDTSTLEARTAALCGVPAVNMMAGKTFDIASISPA